MILIFHLSKYFFLNYKLFLRSTTPEDIPRSCLDDLQYLRRLKRLSGVIFVKMDSVFLFGNKGPAVIFQGF